MPTFVALLRGVNVGGAKRVSMAELRRMLVELGYTEVSTLLNSGNAVFRASGSGSAKHAAAIAAAIRRELALEVTTIVKSAADLTAITHENPFGTSAPDYSRLLVAFASSRAALNGLQAMTPLVAPSEQFLIGRHAAYLHCADGILKSRAGAALLGKLGRAITTRNWSTVLKLRALARSDTP
jgi:uncharacterized protein (DUF1697 family)